MINKEDPSEWLAQIDLTPASAPIIVRTLVSRIKSLNEYNEELRNENISLREKIDTKAYQKEAQELKRQIRALGRLAKGCITHQEANNVIISWTNQGFVLVLEWDKTKAGESILVPLPDPRFSQVIRLLNVSAADEVLFLTNLGRIGTFEVQSLIKLKSENLVWHKLPGLILGDKEFISLLLPVGMLPISDSLITLSRGGYTRSINKLIINQFMQTGELGKGVKDERDVQAFACLVVDKQADVVLFTGNGHHLRFPAGSIGPGVIQALKLDSPDKVIGMISNDQFSSQVLVFDRNGKAARRSIDDFPERTIGVRSQPAFSAEEIVGVKLTNETDQVVILAGKEQLSLTMMEGKQVPLNDRARSLAQIPGLNDRVHDFVSIRSDKWAPDAK
jgi:DNA gyrase/topoisomerase IV subunit A